jgi:hypothetical protein
MQVMALLVWLGLAFLVAKVVNFMTRRPVMNPWTWFAASYAALYIVGIAIGASRGNQDIAYLAGSFLPITALAVALGIWRAPKWRAKNANIGRTQAHQDGAGSQYADLRS